MRLSLPVRIGGAWREDRGDRGATRRGRRVIVPRSARPPMACVNGRTLPNCCHSISRVRPSKIVVVTNKPGACRHSGVGTRSYVWISERPLV